MIWFNRMPHRILFVLVVLCFVSMPSRAELALSQFSGNENLSEHISFVEDKASAWSVDDVYRSFDELRWIENRETELNLGFTQSTYWFRVAMKNDLATKFAGVLGMEYPLLDDIQVYQVIDGGRPWPVAHVGDLQEFSKRIIAHRNFLVPIEQAAGSEAIYLIRVHTSSALQLPLYLGSERDYLIDDFDWMVGQGMFFGIMFIMAAYNLCVYVGVRDKSYLYFVAYVVAFSCAVASIQGTGYQYLWPENAAFQSKCVSWFILMSIVCGALFADAFLNVKTNDALLYKILQAVGGAALFGAVLVPFVDYRYSIQIAIAMALVGCAYFLVLGVILWVKGVREASYFSIAWVVVLSAIVAWSLNKLGVAPRNFLTEYFSQFALSFEVALLSFGLTDRINRERIERIQAKELALTFQRRVVAAQKDVLNSHEVAEKQLAEKVDERTKEISDAMIQLSKANAKLKSMSIIDGLTGVRNRRYFNEMVEREVDKARDNVNPIALLMIDIDDFKLLNDQYGHLVGDECLRAVAEAIQDVVTWPIDAVCRYGGEEFVVLLPNT
ncbi:MAG: sensor domain-containing diguanylate cyclase, partial [Pseudomonadales bacterium]|nr:sensor domain-containing diguanylate cyclase [Pseudomonadales bacterium]